MKQAKIIPSIIAKNQKELNARLRKVSGHARIVQLDVMDGKFVKNKSLIFDFNLPRGRMKYEAHLMMKDPQNWIKKNSRKVDVIIIHAESSVDILELIKLVKSKKKRVGIAINPRSSVASIRSYLGKTNMVLVMTVHPGKYGAKFLPAMLSKIKQLRGLKPEMNIEVDGAVSDKTISRLRKSGANSFVVGSYLQKSGDVGKAIKGLRGAR